MNKIKLFFLTVLAILCYPLELFAAKFSRVYALNQQYPTMREFTQNLVAMIGKVEVIRQPLFDYVTYPTLGSAAPFNFFSVPQGQGLSSSSGNVANPKGEADTNMQLAGQLPAPQAFWCDGIEIDVQPGSSAAANAYVIQIPSAFAVAAAATVQAGAHDVNAILSGGVLSFNISNKSYYKEGPLFRFPPRSALALDVAIESTSATVGESVKEKLRNVGDPVLLNPGFGIMSSQAFGATITYPTAIPTPSGFNARIGVILNGYTFRPVQ
jgi:hypothetical protein